MGCTTNINIRPAQATKLHETPIAHNHGWHGFLAGTLLLHCILRGPPPHILLRIWMRYARTCCFAIHDGNMVRMYTGVFALLGDG